MTEQTTSQTLEQTEDESVRAPSLFARVRSHGSNLVMGGLIAVSGAGLYVMHVHTRAELASTVKPTTVESIGPQTIIAFQKTIAETRKLVDAVQKPSDVINASHTEIGDPFTYVRQRPPEPVTVSAKVEAVSVDQTALKAEASKLNLQSILCGRRNYCLVNNELFTEGQTIGKFVIERITSDAVHVRSGDFTFELHMNRR